MVKEVKLSISKNKFDINNFDHLVDEFTDFLLSAGAISVSNEVFDINNNFFSKSCQIIDANLHFNVHVPDFLDESQFMLEVFSNYNINFDSTFKKIPNVDWVSSSQSSFKPICILNKIWIGASWHKIPINQTQKEMLKIFIDPGQAFGTGAHPTTKFCLEALITLSENKKNSHLLDLGCGSGILSIAACKLGFPFVTAVDNDPLALFVAKENAKLNKIGSNSCLFHTSIENTKGKFDLIISNILCSTLLELSSIIVGKLRKNGSLILTGILNAQVSELREKYLRVSKDKIFLREISSEEDWICLAYFGHQ